MSVRWLALLALLLLLGAGCLDFDEAQAHYCATHSLCSDGGTADAGP